MKVRLDEKSKPLKYGLSKCHTRHTSCEGFLSKAFLTIFRLELKAEKEAFFINVDKQNVNSVLYQASKYVEV